MVKFTIREARREDCREIRRLIQELADFEKMPDGPRISAEVLERDGFDTKPPLFHCYVAELDDKPGHLIGYAFYFYSYGTWLGRKLHLEDIFVTGSHRGTGVGYALFRQIAEKAVEMNCPYVEFVVLHWNPAKDFYAKVGARNTSDTEGWQTYRLEQSAMKNLIEKK